MTAGPGTGPADADAPDAPDAPDDVRAAVDAAFRTEWGLVVAAVIGRTGDWDLAEECAQDAFAQALATWPRSGVPRRPGAWLTTAGTCPTRIQLSAGCGTAEP